jgi:hypothetical protein
MNSMCKYWRDLKSLQTLQLDLINNKVGDEGIESVANALSHLT